MLQDKWVGLLHHVTGEHAWALGECDHAPLVEQRDKEWIEKGSKAHQTLTRIVLDARWLKNVHKYLNFRFVQLDTQLTFTYADSTFPFNCTTVVFYNNTAEILHIPSCISTGRPLNWSLSIIIYLCMLASASASPLVFIQHVPCLLAWTTTTTFTDQSGEDLMAPFSMLFNIFLLNFFCLYWFLLCTYQIKCFLKIIPSQLIHK